MKNARFVKARFVFALLLAFILILGSVQSASANVRLQGGGDVPFYARIESANVYHNSDWAVIVFYRPPECIPTDFNLLAFFDAPGAFGCGPYTTDGFAVWKDINTDNSPLQSKLFGLGAVPVWFVSWPALESAVEDGVLTIVDLQAMNPLQGTASYYEETLHPTGNGHPSMLEFVARGTLADGRTFDVQAHGTDAQPVPTTHIVIK